MVNTFVVKYKFVDNVGLEHIGLLANMFHSNIEEKITVEACGKVIDKFTMYTFQKIIGGYQEYCTLF